jgi:hypothetical protein
VLDLSDLKAGVINRPKEGRNALLRFVERWFKTLHTFSQVDAGGTQLQLRLNLSSADNGTSAPPLPCDYDTASPRPVLQAS